MKPNIQGDRYNANKPKLSMIFEAPHAMTGLARVLEHGEQKYARANWLHGLPQTEISDSMLRHLLAFISGEDNCPDSGLPHVDHVLCNAMFLSQMHHRRPDTDNRAVRRSEDRP